MKICIIRHGETDWNLEKKRQGRKDIPLNDRGIQQAAECGKYLRGGEWKHIISSPLSRAYQTATIVANIIGVDDVSIDCNLIERDFGKLEGLSYVDSIAIDDLNSNCNIESKLSVKKRICNSIKQIVEEFYPDDVIVISHGSVIKSFIKNFMQETEKFHMKNGSLSLLEYTNESYTLVYYNKIISQIKS